MGIVTFILHIHTRNAFHYVLANNDILNLVNLKWYFFIGVKCFCIIDTVKICFIIVPIYVSLTASEI